MKKTIAALGALLLMSGLALQAQQSSVYVKAGLNLANISVNKDGQVDDSRTLPSFHAGLQGNLPVGSFFAIQPGVFFTGKGSKLESGNTSGDNWYRVSTRP